MSFSQIFEAELFWELNPGENTENPRNYSRNHEVKIADKELLELSAAKSFKGDTNLLNPEDLLLSALTSCHMMSYLYVCAQHNIAVLSYTDKSKGVLEVVGEGGRFKSVALNPVVTLQNAKDIELAKELHTKANELCFIANSCNFPIHHKATIRVG
ncbi:osmotically inducible protein OsmC [Putridiphycobacter roseus]|uniref:Osmotically inducible protein OsmC n=1 Tax=Putridiphycobacter roseus TaxID=2219161 RepID=A0A2W1N9G5_9FLAO|nr:OsmC family protein [Putridiphycobacter roseus]PZE15905.1 osmotically inducible protein OsmC [Putridiphycobacter roseus]